MENQTNPRPTNRTHRTIEGSAINFQLDDTLIFNGSIFVIVSENWGTNPTEPESFTFEDHEGNTVTVINDR